MPTVHHSFSTKSGLVNVDLNINRMSGVEAVDLNNLDARFFDDGGWKIEGFINGKNAGTEFVRNDCADYMENSAELVALGFVDPGAVFDRQHADIAEYAVMYGIPFDAALGIFTLCGHDHIKKHITSRRMMPC